MAPELSVFLCFLLCISALYQVESSTTGPVFACGNPALSSFPFCNPSLGIPARVEDLVKRLTLQEKVRFLGDVAGGVARLGIPEYRWWSEALHGVSYVGHATKFSPLVPGATSFPQVILTAASFNTSLFEAIGAAVSTEARAMYNVGLAGLTYWSPNVNIFRDPRWGRGQETPGEDPFLSSKYASSYVRGLQGTTHGQDHLKVAACCKHYTAYDVDNWNNTDRYHFNAVVTPQDMDDTFQPPFRSCVLDGNVASVMCSYNKVNGKPTCADPDLLAGVVRKDWKLNGYVVSDCDSVDVMFNSQHYTSTPEEAAAKALLAGLDLNCGTFLQNHTESAVKSGLVTEAHVDNAISNNFATLMRLGFFNGDPRDLPYGTLGAEDVCTREHQELARDAARQGIVLLKNEAGSLPLSKSGMKTLAVIGPNANASTTMIGNYAGTPCRFTTPLEALSAVVPTVYHPACSIYCGAPEIDHSRKIAAAADATVLVVGTNLSIEAESLDRTHLHLPGQQALLVNEVASASKGPVILVIMSGGGFDVSFAKSNPRISSMLWVGLPGEAGGSAIADVIFGSSNPSGRLPMTWYPQSYVDKVPMTTMNMRPDPSTGYPGRTYRFYSGETVFDFGYGLSYSYFKHRLLRAAELVSVPLDDAHVCRSTDCQSFDAVEPRCSGVVYHLHLHVTNRGASAGSHTVLLFSTPPSKHNPPRKQLLGFEKMHLDAKEEKVVRFKLDVCRDFSVVDEAGNRKVLLGPHVLHVGNLKHSFNLTI